jgi:hypothetical protein
LLLLLVVIAPSSVDAQSNWKTYTNVRFAFALDYPADVFTSFEESDNSDGATFETKQPDIELRAYGFWNSDKKSPRAYFTEYYKDKKVSFSSVKRDSYVASGTDGAAIFYDRCNFSGDRVICFNLSYPAAQKDKWDKTVARLATSLRPVKAGHGR